MIRNASASLLNNGRYLGNADGCNFLSDMCLSSIDHDANFWAILLELILFCYAFVGLAIVCDDYLVMSLEVVCERLNVREDVAGATFMAFGSAAPEIVVNAVTTVKQATAPPDSHSDQSSIGVGAIIGSGIIAFLLIPSACALAVPNEIKVHLKRRPLLRDMGTYAISLLLLVIFFSDGVIQLYEAGILVVTYACYVVVVICAPTVRRVFRIKILGEKVKRQESFVVMAAQARTLREKLLEGMKSDETLTSTGDEEVAAELQFEQCQGKIVRFDMCENKEDKDLIMEDIEAAETHSIISNGCDTREEDNGDLLIAQNSDLETSLVDSVPDSSATASGAEEEEEPSTFIGRIVWRAAWPLRMMFKYTCPYCAPDSKWTNLYPVTFIMSFLWVAFFSFVISTIVERWVDLGLRGNAKMGGEWYGLVLISIGAEIPDTIQSVTGKCATCESR